MLIKKLISIPKTIYANMVLFPLKTALKIPVIVSYDTKLRIFRGGYCLKGMYKKGGFP